MSDKVDVTAEKIIRDTGGLRKHNSKYAHTKRGCEACEEVTNEGTEEDINQELGLENPFPNQ